MRTVFGNLLACAVIATSAHAAGRSAAPAQLTRGAQNHLLLRAQVNGHALTLLVDTGADLSFLPTDRAQALEIRSSGEQGFSGGRWFPLATVQNFQAGGAQLGHTTFALYNPSETGPIPGRVGKAADGVIGLDLLRRFRAVIDCHARQMFFRTDRSASLGLPATTRTSGFVQIPMQENRSRNLTVPCTLRGKAGRLVVDTGAFVTVLDDQAVRAVNLTTLPSPLTARGLDGRIRKIELADVDDLKIGSLRIVPQPFASMDLFAENKPKRAYTGINRINSTRRARAQPASASSVCSAMNCSINATASSISEA